MPTDALAARRASDLRLMTRLIVAALSLGILAGFFGAEIHAFDSVGHFRGHLTALLTVATLAALILRLWITGLFGTAAAILGLATTIPYLVPDAGQRLSADAARPRYSLLQMNLRFSADPTLALRRIGESAPDVVTVQEGTRDWRRTFEALRHRYPYQFFCDGDSSVGDSGVLSRRPFLADSEGLCMPGAGYAAQTIDFNGVPATVGSLHLDWPWPHRHWSQIARLAASAFAEPLPRIVSGDFNAAPWSAAVGTVTEASGTIPIASIGPTWIHRTLPKALAGNVGLPIDNVLVSAEVEVLRAERLPATSSDHLPVLVTFHLAAPAPAGPRRLVVQRQD